MKGWRIFSPAIHDTSILVRTPITVKVIIGFKIMMMLTLLASVYLSACARQP